MTELMDICRGNRYKYPIRRWRNVARFNRFDHRFKPIFFIGRYDMNAVCVPLLGSPMGWILLGVGGYALYKVGKNKGEKQAKAVAPLEVPEVKAKEAKK